MSIDEINDFLIENNIATQEEIDLVCNINGIKIETLNDISFVRTGYRSVEQMIEGEYENEN